MRGPGGRWGGPGGYRFYDRHTRNLPGVEKMSLLTETEKVYSYKSGEKIESYINAPTACSGRSSNSTSSKARLTQTTTRRMRTMSPSSTTRRAGNSSATSRPPARRLKLTASDSAVGVVANVPYLRQIPFADIWAPISTTKTKTYRDELMGNFMAIYLARSSADFPAIKEEFQARLKQVEFPDPAVEPDVRRDRNPLRVLR